jgi:colanic acid/amylovoran biosynthesis glycosyltransferase
MPSNRIRKILVICAVGSDAAARVLSKLASQFKKPEINMIISTQFAEGYRSIRSIHELYNLADGDLPWRIIPFVRKLRKESYDLLVIVTNDVARLHYPNDAVLLSLLIHTKKRIVMDPDMVSRNIGIRTEASSLLDGLALLLGIPIAKLLTKTVFGIASISRRHNSVPPTSKARMRSNRVAVILPVIPDVSHTFIYREVLAMKRQGADFDLISLEEGDRRIMHEEVIALLPETTFVPKISAAKYLALYLYFLFRNPLRMRWLVSFYALHGANQGFLFLDVRQFRNPLHPCSGLTLAWELKKLRTSYVHVYGSSYPATRALVASSLLGIPFSLGTFVDFDYPYDFKNFREKTELARFVVASTRFCAKRIRAYTSEEIFKKVHVVHFGISRDFAPRGSRKAAVSGERPGCIIAIGRLVEKKGFEYLVKACSILKTRKISVPCVIVGEGPEKSRLKELVRILGLKKDVKLPGYVWGRRFKSFMRPENILVVPSVYAKDGERDGIPEVMLEAMLCEVPVVSTTVSGIPEAVTDGENGLLVRERDEKALANAIERLVRHKGLRQRLGRNARARVLKSFDVDKSARELWSLIRAASGLSQES